MGTDYSNNPDVPCPDDWPRQALEAVDAANCDRDTALAEKLEAIEEAARLRGLIDAVREAVLRSSVFTNEARRVVQDILRGEEGEPNAP